MEDVNQNIDLNSDFLKLLGVKKKKASLKTLSELVYAHITTVPFENISKLHYRKQFNLEYIPDFRRYLNGISENCFGGTCYSNNYFFFKLLRFLGFDVKLCGAEINGSDSHMVIIVTISNQDFLVDVGFAAPFSYPIPLYLKSDHIISSGHDKYIFKPRDNKGLSRLEMFRNGILKHGYLVKPVAKNIEDFNKVISDSFKNASTFLNSLLITKYISGSFFTIHNLELIESKQYISSISQISNVDELSNLIKKIFNIPLSITREIMKSMNSFRETRN